MEPQVALVEREEQVFGSLVLQWVQDSKVSENSTEGNTDCLEVWSVA